MLLESFNIKRKRIPEDDCACSVTSENVFPIEVKSLTIDWQISPDLLIYYLPAGQFLIDNPERSGIIALLNQQELELLNAFSSPRSLDLIDDCAHLLSDEQAKVLERQWIRLGFLTPSESDCACISMDSTYQYIQPFRGTLTSWLHLTDRCNLRCSYCYLPHLRRDMSPETGRAAVDATFRSAIANGFKQVKLKYAGGEPLLRFPLIAELHQYAQSLAEQHELNLEGVVLSNGTLLTVEMVEVFKSLNLRLMISLDGLGQCHDGHRSYTGGRSSSADVIEAIELAQVHGLTPNISITVSGRNIDGLPEILGWVLVRDLPFSINFYRENDHSAGQSDLELEQEKIISGMLAAFGAVEANLPRRSLLAALTDRANLAAPHLRTCGVGQNYLVFDSRGQVSKCQMQMDKPVAVGAGEDVLAAVRKDGAGIQNLSVEEKEGCRDCQWRYWCAGGCPLQTYRATGRYDVKSPNCHIYQAIFPVVLRLEGLRLMKYQDDPQVVQKITL